MDRASSSASHARKSSESRVLSILLKRPEPVKVASSFHLFQKLPMELRLQIWKAALPEPRYRYPYWRQMSLGLETQSKAYCARLKSTFEVTLDNNDSALLNVNQEARAVVLAHYSYRPGYFGSLLVSQCSLFDFETDVILMRTDDVLHFFRSGGIADALRSHRVWEYTSGAKSVGGDAALIRNLSIQMRSLFNHVEHFLDQVAAILLELKTLQELEISISSMENPDLAFHTWSLVNVEKALRSRCNDARSNGKPLRRLRLKLLRETGASRLGFEHLHAWI